MTLRIDHVALDDLDGHDENPKGHDRDTIGGSLELFGYIDPIVVDERTGLIVSGHGRRDTLRDLRTRGDRPPDGIEVGDDGTWLVPVVAGWRSASDDAARAALVALNRTTERGGWDNDALVSLLDRLGDLDEWHGIGYDERELDELRRQLAGREMPAPDEFESLDLDAELDHQCPSCGYEWNGPS